MFPERSVRVLTEEKNVNVSYVFDLKSHVYCKCDNSSKEIARR